MIDRSRFARLGALVPAALAAVLLVGARAVHAEDESPPGEPVRVLRPNAIRGVALAQVGGLFSGPLSHGFLGGTYSRQLHRFVAAEATFGRGGGGSRRGSFAGAGARVSLIGGDRSAFTFSPGVHVGFLDGYGPVAFGQLELAWELRTRFGLDLVLGGGAGITLTSSRTLERECTPFLWECRPDRFTAGDSTMQLHLELGYAF